MICYPTPKINIGLNVLRKRPDGYHDIETLFYPVAAFSDELEIVRADGLPEGSPFAAGKPVRDGFSITIEGADWDPQDDLTAKAWRLLAAEYGIGPVRIRMRKGIPVGAGFGIYDRKPKILILLHILFEYAARDELSIRNEYDVALGFIYLALRHSFP